MIARRILQSSFAGVALMISAASLASYVFDVERMRLWLTPPMAVNTAICLFCLSLDRMITCIRHARQ